MLGRLLALPCKCHGQRGVVRRFGRLPDLGQAEIQQFDPGFRNQNIRGFQVSVSNAFVVRGVERVANLYRIIQRLSERQRPLSGTPSRYSNTR